MVGKQEKQKEVKKDHPNKIDLVGKKFGRLTVIKDTGKRPSRRVVYECLCDCGNVKEVYGNNLSSGKSKSCGCLKGATKDLIGKNFGELTVIKELNERRHTNKVWLCECSCGKEHKATTNSLVFGRVKSCGCSISPDISGERFGRLVVMEETGESVRGHRTWRCKCDCGIDVVVKKGLLTSGGVKSCGCLAQEHRERFSDLIEDYRHLNKGKNHYNYNPLITDEERIKMRYEISGNDRRVWRMSVYHRDEYTCQICREKGGELNAHHLNGYHWYEKGRYDVDNGVTLCDKCHSEFHGIYGYGENTKEQFVEYETSKCNKTRVSE